MKKINFGIILILLSSASVAFGQLFWKLGIDNFIFIFLGFVLYFVGAVLMIFAFRFGEISILQPMLGFSYILSFVLSYSILNENIGISKICGIVFIVIGMAFLSRGANA